MEKDDTQYFGYAGHALGFSYGLYFAFKRQSGFLGYIGWGILWGLIGGGVGTAVDYTVKALGTKK